VCTVCNTSHPLHRLSQQLLNDLQSSLSPRELEQEVLEDSNESENTANDGHEVREEMVEGGVLPVFEDGNRRNVVLQRDERRHVDGDFMFS